MNQLTFPANSAYASVKSLEDVALNAIIADYKVFAADFSVQTHVEEAFYTAFGGNWLQGFDFPVAPFKAEGDAYDVRDLLIKQVFADLPCIIAALPDATDVETAAKNFWGSIEAAAAGFLAKLIEHKLTTQEQWQEISPRWYLEYVSDLTKALERLQGKCEHAALEQASAPKDSDPDAQELREELDALALDKGEYISDDELAVQKAISSFAAKKLACK